MLQVPLVRLGFQARSPNVSAQRKKLNLYLELQRQQPFGPDREGFAG